MNGGRFTGSPFAHPNAEKIGTASGFLSYQAMAFREGIGALRMMIKSRDVGFKPIPDQIDLIMDGPWHVHGSRVIESTSVDPSSRTGYVRFILTRREDRMLYWTVVEIHDDAITATLYRNPPDEQLTPTP